MARGRNASQRVVNASASGCSVAHQRRPSSVSCCASSADSISAHAQPYGRSNVARDGGDRYSVSTATLAGVMCASKSARTWAACGISGMRRSRRASSQ